MNTQEVVIAVAVAMLITLGGITFAPFAVADRLAPFTTLFGQAIGGISHNQIDGALSNVNQYIQEYPIIVKLEDTEEAYTLGQLGVSLDIERTKHTLSNQTQVTEWLQKRSITPLITIDEQKATQIILQDFGRNVTLPQNASLVFTLSGVLQLQPSAPGETIDVLALEQDIRRLLISTEPEPIVLHFISAAAEVQDSEVSIAQDKAEQLLRSGFTLQFEDNDFILAPYTVRRLLEFGPVTDPNDSQNTILGVHLNPEATQAYLDATIAPQVNQGAVNARFEVAPESQEDTGQRVTQFAVPQRGQSVNGAATLAHIEEAITTGQSRATIAVDITEPEISNVAGIQSLGVTTLLASGVSDFVGSPVNRVHNIRVGAERYHGLLIAPGQEFSFNEYLGPVDASAGFKPELVIKNNVTAPEYGGGLCQVSTTAFRAALHSGLEITERRNHSYAVSYYGTPGFDATIYPGHTDLRFLNNTPGYILIQTRIEGTKLIFDFWGTDDGREVEIDGPHPYDRQPNGAVKATLEQVVTRNSEVVTEESFFSNYKSPKLFPKVLSANGESAPAGETPPAAPGGQPPKPNDITTPTSTPNPAT